MRLGCERSASESRAIQPAQGIVVDAAELQAEKPAARSKHAVCLGQDSVHVGAVSDPKGHGHRMKRLVGEWKRLGVALDPVHLVR